MSITDLELNRRLLKQEERLDHLEEWQHHISTAAAVRAEREIHLDKRFDHIEESLKEVKGYLLRIVWIILAGIVGSLITFIVSGGLAGYVS